MVCLGIWIECQKRDVNSDVINGPLITAQNAVSLTKDGRSTNINTKIKLSVDLMTQFYNIINASLILSSSYFCWKVNDFQVN